MGLTDNIKAMQAKQVTPPAAAAAPAAEPALVTNDMNQGLVPAAAPAVTPAGSADPDPAAAKPAVFAVGDQEFATVEDAMKYAQTLAAEKVQRDAYEQGIKDASPDPAAEKPDPDAAFYKQMSDMMFDDPATAIRMIEQRAVDRAASQITQATEQTQNRTKTWDKFYTDNKDLSVHRDIVDFILEKNWATLGPMQPDKALQKLAELTRGRLQKALKDMRPEEVLPSGSAMATSATGAPLATPVPEKQKLDFTQLVRKLNKRELKELL